MGKVVFRPVWDKAPGINELRKTKIFGPETPPRPGRPTFSTARAEEQSGGRTMERNPGATPGFERSGGYGVGRTVGEQSDSRTAGPRTAGGLRPHGPAAERLGRRRAAGTVEPGRTDSGQRIDGASGAFQRRLKEYFRERMEKQSMKRRSPGVSSSRQASESRMRQAARRIWRPSSDRGLIGRLSARAACTPS